MRGSMEKRKNKVLNKILLALLLIVLVSLFSITFAWFTDKKEYSGTLNFGAIELDVSGDGVNNATKELQFSTTRQANSDATWTGKIMPGDVVNIPLNVGLTSSSESAYYLVHITDAKNVFENAYYFFDGTYVYVNDGTKTYRQGDSSKTPVSDKYVGMLEKDASGHDITISAVVATSVTEQGITTTIKCDVYAIQQANLDISMAKYILTLNFRTPLILTGSGNTTNVNAYTITSASENADTYFRADYNIEPGTTYRVSFTASVNSSNSWLYYLNGSSNAFMLENGYNEIIFTHSGTKVEKLLWDDAKRTPTDPFTITNLMIEIVG